MPLAKESRAEAYPPPIPTGATRVRLCHPCGQLKDSHAPETLSIAVPEELNEADRWLREAKEELAVATHVHSGSQLPSRVVCFHAHLAAEKALKSLQIRRGVLVRKIRNLAQLVRELPEEDRGRFDFSHSWKPGRWSARGPRRRRLLI